MEKNRKGKIGNAENNDPNEGDDNEDTYSGVSKPRVLSMGPSDSIDDKYNI